MKSPGHTRKLRLKKTCEAFYLIYHCVGESSPRARIFNADYGLFRALLRMFALLTGFALADAVWAAWRQRARLAPFAVRMVLFALATLIAYPRCRKRSEDFAQSVFDLFPAAGSGHSVSQKTS